MTQDVYCGRKVANPRAADDVEQFMAAGSDDEDSESDDPEDESHG